MRVSGLPVMGEEDGVGVDNGADGEVDGEVDGDDSLVEPDGESPDYLADDSHDLPPAYGAGDLTPKQQLFVDNFLIDLNARAAARRAGYTSRQAGVHLRANPRVREAIQAAIDERAKRLRITQDRVLFETVAIAFSNIGHYMTIDQDGQPRIDLRGLGIEELRAIQEIRTETTFEPAPDGEAEPTKIVKTKLRLHPPTQALKLLFDHMGMLPRTMQLTGPGGGPVQVQALEGLSEKELGDRMVALAEKLREMMSADTRRLVDERLREMLPAGDVERVGG